ncbi:hypothetical protein IRB23M11_15260 [Alkalibacterium sp. m-11]|uniref:Glycosyltransferase 2-like domain-containing protein n=1 Tax=Alkalibacterium indicireducens TaxID=398758 RepID=A0ABN1AIN3_9LACT
MNTFSVIMPVYKVEDYVEKAIVSILAQDYKDFELIIVNDGTPDNSMQIVEKYALKDSRIKVINQRNKGLSAARNTGLKAATGEYVCFVDSDDEVDSYLLSFTKEILDECSPDILMFGMYAETIAEDEGVSETEYWKIDRSNWARENFKKLTVDDTFLNLMGYATNKLYKLELLKKHSIFFNEDIYFLEDIEFNEKVYKVINTMTIIDDCFYHYKFRSRKSLVNSLQDNHFTFLLGAIRSRKEIFEDWGMEPEGIAQIVGILHLRAIRATCSLLFEHSNDITFAEKCQHLYLILHDPYTVSRSELFPSANLIDKVLKAVIKKRQVYTLAIISSLYGFTHRHLSHYKKNLKAMIVK